MKDISFFSFCLMIVFLVVGCAPTNTIQNYKPHRKKYIHFMEEGSTFVDGGYHYMIERLVSGDYAWKIFYPDTEQMTHYYTYKDRSLQQRQGRSAEWWDNGTLFYEGQYEKGKREGKWKQAAGADDTSTATGSYVNGKQEGSWITTNKEGEVTSKYNYLKGKRHGAYEIYSAQGELVERGRYENGNKVESENLSKDGKPNEKFRVVETMPEFKGCEDEKDKDIRKKCAEKKMLELIYGNIRYPRVARENGVEGKCIAQFVVNKEGQIVDVNIKRGLCKEIKEEVQRVISLMPTWYPGTQNGEPVKVVFTLPVRFKLQ